MLFLFIFIHKILYSFDKEKYKLIGKAENISIDVKNNNFYAKNDTTIKIKDISISSKHLFGSQNTIKAYGYVKYYQNKLQIAAEYIEVKLLDWSLNARHVGTYTNNLFIYSKELYAQFPKILIARNGHISTCSLAHPHYSITAKVVYLYPDLKVTAYGGYFCIGPVQLFPIIYSTYLNYDPNRSPLFPTISYNQKDGLYMIMGINNVILNHEQINMLGAVYSSIMTDFKISNRSGLAIKKLEYKFNIEKHFELLINLLNWKKTKIGKYEYEFKTTNVIDTKNSSFAKWLNCKLNTTYNYFTEENNVQFHMIGITKKLYLLNNKLNTTLIFHWMSDPLTMIDKIQKKIDEKNKKRQNYDKITSFTIDDSLIKSIIINYNQYGNTKIQLIDQKNALFFTNKFDSINRKKEKYEKFRHNLINIKQMKLLNLDFSWEQTNQISWQTHTNYHDWNYREEEAEIFKTQLSFNKTIRWLNLNLKYYFNFEKEKKNKFKEPEKYSFNNWINQENKTSEKYTEIINQQGIVYVNHVGLVKSGCEIFKNTKIFDIKTTNLKIDFSGGVATEIQENFISSIRPQHFLNKGNLVFTFNITPEFTLYQNLHKNNRLIDMKIFFQPNLNQVFPWILNENNHIKTSTHSLSSTIIIGNAFNKHIYSVEQKGEVKIEQHTINLLSINNVKPFFNYKSHNEIIKDNIYTKSQQYNINWDEFRISYEKIDKKIEEEQRFIQNLSCRLSKYGSIQKTQQQNIKQKTQNDGFELSLSKSINDKSNIEIKTKYNVVVKNFNDNMNKQMQPDLNFTINFTDDSKLQQYEIGRKNYLLPEGIEYQDLNIKQEQPTMQEDEILDEFDQFFHKLSSKSQALDSYIEQKISSQNKYHITNFNNQFKEKTLLPNSIMYYCKAQMKCDFNSDKWSLFKHKKWLESLITLKIHHAKIIRAETTIKKITNDLIFENNFSIGFGIINYEWLAGININYSMSNNITMIGLKLIKQMHCTTFELNFNYDKEKQSPIFKFNCYLADRPDKKFEFEITNQGVENFGFHLL